jgi:hypothetical protein
VETIDTGRLVERMATAARVIHRFSRWGAGAGLVVAAVAFLSLAPWLPGLGIVALPVGAVCAVVLLGAPLRVMWHGGRIGAAYGDRVHVDALLAEIPGAVDDLARELEAAVRPQGRGLRRVVSSWRSMLAVRRLVEESPARERAEVLVDPLRPEALSLTTTAMVVTVIILVTGLPVALSSLLTLALT